MRIIGTILAGLCWLLLAGAALAEPRLALVIGNADYPRELGVLRNPPADAQRIGDALASAGFTVTRRSNLDGPSMQREIAAFASALKRAGPQAVGFFYYSGHGASAEAAGQRKNFLIPSRTPVDGPEQLALLAVPMEGVIDSLAATKAKAVFVVSDACRNTLPFTSAKGGEVDKAFTAVSARAGLFIAFATADGATAPDDGKFSEALARQIAAPGQPAGQAFLRAFQEVAKSRPGNKLPFLSPGLLEDICFRGCGVEPVTAELERLRRENAELRRPKPAETRVAENTVRAPPSVPAATAGVSSASAVRPGQSFRDCADCPEMVAIPGGSFLMGSPSGEAGRDSDEGPQRRVTIAGFAAGKFEVTFAEWDACVAAGGCNGYRPEDWGRGTRPVNKLSWQDAQAYVAWLSRKTGQRYRLLTEAEWEYAARAGTTTPYATGASISTSQAHFRSNSTAAVGSFPANAFGLHDMHGNVWEWVEDCYQDSYSNAPTTGAAVTTSNCAFRVIRGGYPWGFYPQVLRSAGRYRNSPSYRSIFSGFRLARTL